MKIVIFGASGFLGEGLIKQLRTGHEIFAISRRVDDKHQSDEKLHWIQSDLMRDKIWQDYARGADWLIDCIGILAPGKGKNYQNSSLDPAKGLIHFLAELPAETRPRFLFVSAKKMPFFFNPGYMRAKLDVEKEMLDELPESSLSIFPSLIYDKSRKSKAFGARLLKILHLKNYQPQSREYIAEEVGKILLGQPSKLTHKDY